MLQDEVWFRPWQWEQQRPPYLITDWESENLGKEQGKGKTLLITTRQVLLFLKGSMIFK